MTQPLRDGEVFMMALLVFGSTSGILGTWSYVVQYIIHCQGGGSNARLGGGGGGQELRF